MSKQTYFLVVSQMSFLGSWLCAGPSNFKTRVLQFKTSWGFERWLIISLLSVHLVMGGVVMMDTSHGVWGPLTFFVSTMRQVISSPTVPHQVKIP